MALPAIRGSPNSQDQFGRIFNELFERSGQDSNLSSWAPAVDIFENEHELVVKADFARCGSEGSRHSCRE